MYIGNVQWAVDGRVIALIKAWPSGGGGFFNRHSLHYLSMRNFYTIVTDDLELLSLNSHYCVFITTTYGTFDPG